MLKIKLTMHRPINQTTYIEVLTKSGERLPLEFKNVPDDSVLFLKAIGMYVPTITMYDPIPYRDCDKIGKEGLNIKDVLEGIDENELRNHIYIGYEDGSEANPDTISVEEAYGTTASLDSTLLTLEEF